MKEMAFWLSTPLGSRWKSYSTESTTTVWPALLPPCTKHTHSAQSGSSLQHWDQITKADHYITPQPAVEQRVSLPPLPRLAQFIFTASCPAVKKPCVLFWFFSVDPSTSRFSWCRDGTSMSYQSELHACGTLLVQVGGGAFRGRSV